jgi:hypothetical protein
VFFVKGVLGGACRVFNALVTLALAVVLAAFALGVFVYALQLPLPIWPSLAG